MKTIRIILVLTMMVISSVCLSAQKQINDVLKKIEMEKDVRVTYIEKRDTKSKKVYIKSKVISFQDEKFAEELIKAIEASRENSVSFESINERMRKILFASEDNTDIYEILFQEKTFKKELKYKKPRYKYSITIRKVGFKACNGSFPEWE
ncbi:MAG: DUF5024 domain-containing protein [Muribaculaceae bacterium]|nr:DUF5024 domain-containing protein [Muribaculaceae bacterium]